MFYLVYKTTNNVNGKYYIGAHKTNNIGDNYLGSGVALRRAIKKYGKKNFTKEIIGVFTEEHSMFEAEKKFVEESIRDRKCYNMRSGGKGGFDHIDNRGDKNPMRNPKIARKLGKKISEIRKNNPKFLEISLKNLEKAREANLGRKKPEHSQKMKVLSRQMWDREGFREKFKNTKNSWFIIISPDGKKTETNRLTEFCEENKLPFSTIWTNHESGKAIKKGKAKGWRCQKIMKK